MTPFRLALAGSFQLFRLDERGLANFANSLPGFWHSFNALWVIVPLNLLVSLMANAVAETTTGELDAVALVGDVLFTVVDWTIYLVLIAELGDRFGQPQRQLLYMTAHNWLVVPQAMLMWATMIIMISGSAAGFGQLLFVVAVFVTLGQKWWLARRAFGSTPLQAFSLVSIETGLSLALGIVRGGV